MARAPNVLWLTLLVLSLSGKESIWILSASLPPTSAPNGPTVGTPGEAAKATQVPAAVDQQPAKPVPDQSAPVPPVVPFQKFNFGTFKFPPQFRLAPPTKIKVNKGSNSFQGFASGKTKLMSFKLSALPARGRPAGAIPSEVIPPVPTQKPPPTTPAPPRFNIPAIFLPNRPVIHHAQRTTQLPIQVLPTQNKVTTLLPKSLVTTKPVPGVPVVVKPGPVVPETPGGAGEVKPGQPPKPVPDGRPNDQKPSLPVYQPYWYHNNYIPFVPKPLHRGHTFVPQHLRKHDLLDMLAWLPPDHHAHVLKQLEESNRVLDETDSGPKTDLAKESHAVAANVGAAAGGVLAAVDAALIADKVLNGKNDLVNDEKPQTGKPGDNKPDSNEQHPIRPQTQRPTQQHIRTTKQPDADVVLPPVIDKVIPTAPVKNKDKSDLKPDISNPNSDIAKEVKDVGNSVGKSGGAVVGAVDAALVVDKILNGEGSKNEDLSGSTRPNQPTEQPTPLKPGLLAPEAKPTTKRPDIAKPVSESSHMPLVDKDSNTDTDFANEVNVVANQVGGSGGAVVGAVDVALVVDKVVNGDSQSGSVDLQPNQLPKINTKAPGKQEIPPTHHPNENITVIADKSKNVVPPSNTKGNDNSDTAKEAQVIGSQVGSSGSAVVGAVAAALVVDKVVNGDEPSERADTQPTQRPLQRPNEKDTDQSNNVVPPAKPEDIADKPSIVPPNNIKDNAKLEAAKEAKVVGSQVGSSGGAVVGAVDAALVVDKVVNENGPSERADSQPANQPPKQNTEASRKQEILPTPHPKEKDTANTDQSQNFAPPSKPEGNVNKPADTAKEAQDIGSQVGGSGGAVVGAVDAALVVDKVVNGDSPTGRADSQPNQPPLPQRPIEKVTVIPDQLKNGPPSKPKDITDKPGSESPDNTDDSEKAETAKEAHVIGSQVGGSGGAVVSAVDAALVVDKVVNGDGPSERADSQPNQPPPPQRPNEKVTVIPDQSKSVAPPSKPADKLSSMAPVNTKDNEKPDTTKETRVIGNQVGGSGGAVVGAVDAALVVDKVVNEDGPSERMGSQPNQPPLQRPNVKVTVIPDQSKNVAPPAPVIKPKENADKPSNMPPDDTKDNSKSDAAKEAHLVGSQVGGSGGAVVGAVDSALVANKVVNNGDGEIENSDQQQKDTTKSGQLDEADTKPTAQPVTKQVTISDTTEGKSAIVEPPRNTDIAKEASAVGSHVGSSGGAVVGAVDSAIVLDKVLDQKPVLT